MNKICIITNVYRDKEFHLTNEIKKYIEDKDGSCCVVTEHQNVPDDAEAIFVLGGDGTLIRAAETASAKDIPLIGVNMGHLGYLCELEETTVYPAIDRIMQDDYFTEERMMLSGYSVTAKEGRQFQKKWALNDIVICRKGNLQLVEVIVSVNGEYLNTFRADGVIVATPTGSTAYSMSAGGPIIDPKARMILITPINAHNLNTKSIVIGAEDEVSIELGSRQSQIDEKVDVYFDGEQAVELSSGDSITIHTSRRKTKIIKLSKISFLEILRKKMQTYS
ncbi:MAG: NAD(+)/NADH kinase [Lachnospiraceae bacterium]|nr:NAD(+)/NADH kinase [Lachnospiraceae bacterium]